MSIEQAALLFVGGIAAGFVNTVAGGGSAISVPILVEIVGASVANGTNRVAVLLANITASMSFASGGAVHWKAVWKFIAPATVGAGMGASVASRMSPGDMRTVFGVVLLVVAGSVLVKPKAWVTEREERFREPWRSILFLLIGFYGGFVQIGVGFFLLAGLVFGGGFSLITGNAAKVVIIAVYTAGALFVFAGAAQVDLWLGLVLAAGNSTGALISSRLALRRGAGWIRWFLIVAAVGAALRMFLA